MKKIVLLTLMLIGNTAMALSLNDQVLVNELSIEIRGDIEYLYEIAPEPEEGTQVNQLVDEFFDMLASKKFNYFMLSLQKHKVLSYLKNRPWITDHPFADLEKTESTFEDFFTQLHKKMAYNYRLKDGTFPVFDLYFFNLVEGHLEAILNGMDTDASDDKRAIAKLKSLKGEYKKSAASIEQYFKFSDELLQILINIEDQETRGTDKANAMRNNLLRSIHSIFIKHEADYIIPKNS